MRDSGYPRVDNDFYVEPRWAIEALLDLEPFAGESWDPSCGGGNIPKAMRARGLKCSASDIADHGFGNTGRSFFNVTQTADNIISNPPYGIIEPYIEHALLLARRKVVLLARLALLEGKRRKNTIFKHSPPTRIWVSSRRISMPPGDRPDLKAKGGTVAYAWFVWDRSHRGAAPTIGWF